MSDLLTHAIVLEEIGRLVKAFPSSRRDLAAVADVYRQGLTGVSGQALHFAVDRCIQDDQYFPKVARLRTLAQDFARKHPSPFAPNFPSNDPDVCPVCGARAKHRIIQKLRKDADPLKADSWDEVESRSTYMDHDAERHRHVFDKEDRS